MSVDDVLELYSPNRYEEEFVEHQLQKLAGITLSEARDIIWDFKNRRTRPRKKSTATDRGDPTVRVFEQLSRYYPTNLIDIVAERTRSTNLETLVKYCRVLTQRMFEVVPEELKQSVLREFT